MINNLKLVFPVIGREHGCRLRQDSRNSRHGSRDRGQLCEEWAYGGEDFSEPPPRSPRAANVAGNADRARTIGVNWYANRWVKVQVNGIPEDIEDPALGPVPGKRGSGAACAACCSRCEPDEIARGAL
jgi:hypothetical protein